MPDNSEQQPAGWAPVPDPQVKPLLTIAELASIQGRTRAALYKQIAKGTFPFKLIEYGRNRYKVATAEVHRYVAEPWGIEPEEAEVAAS